jgi:glycosyltransferase involved in cell wall biosynthesis
VKILRVSYRTQPEPGGKERHVGRLTAAQLRLGHAVTVAFRRGALPAGAAPLPLPDTALARLLSVRSDVLAFAAQVGAALQAAPAYDLVHLHGDHVEALRLGPVCRRLRIPLVITVHGALAARHHRLAGWALRHADSVLALGARPADDLARRGVDPARIRIACSGLDLATLDRVRDSAVTQRGLVVSVGALDPVKNHELLIGAWRRARVGRPEARLVIVGDGPDRQRLRGLIGDDGGIDLVGTLPPEDVYRLVSRAEIFVLASRRLAGKGEGVPTAALEAMALGTAVVVSPEASLEPIVMPGNGYRVLASGSVTDLARVLTELLDDDAGRRRLADRGRLAVSGLDWDSTAARIEEWYRSVLPAVLAG